MVELKIAEEICLDIEPKRIGSEIIEEIERMTGYRRCSNDQQTNAYIECPQFVDCFTQKKPGNFYARIRASNPSLCPKLDKTMYGCGGKVCLS